MCQIHPRYLSIVIMIVNSIFTDRKQSLGHGNVFSPVCHSVHRGGGGWLPSMHYRSHDQHPGGSARKGSPYRLGWAELGKRAVRILLECFLVQ